MLLKINEAILKWVWLHYFERAMNYIWKIVGSKIARDLYWFAETRKATIAAKSSAPSSHKQVN